MKMCRVSNLTLYPRPTSGTLFTVARIALKFQINEEVSVTCQDKWPYLWSLELNTVSTGSVTPGCLHHSGHKFNFSCVVSRQLVPALYMCCYFFCLFIEFYTIYFVFLPYACFLLKVLFAGLYNGTQKSTSGEAEETNRH